MGLIMLRKLLSSVILVVPAMVALPALARENYALLIGVNDYPGLEQRWWLKGPGNDVALVAQYLTTEAPVGRRTRHLLRSAPPLLT